ncbi:hypothetical protein [Parvularcula sp. LCG005]|uniref:hypothetical protein n=1 Tax=Parvularcula sp. LCG005 TaxID=3078805 RepID=UPI002943C7D9|nr:hypothetical protein [Parvularcula sp. LCG005]WOI52513.1 hypothetical protein RUI03_10180 [Parvularcula sp. LCG005]
MGKVIAAIVVVLVAAVAWMYFTDTDVEGGEMPSVDVDGGELPDVEVRGPEVSTGTKEVTMEVPTVSVDVPEDDADGLEDEVIDDEGLNAPDVDVEADVDVDDSKDPGN